ncbi:ribonuclease G [Candidatus Aerophobetes bacterium]|uniref:Ribonuclease G n=1 Tax=Aerophobetes bacterium TaxID=2030807 RepID=A0A2A4X954_UNCAE|nr:MAG: ribonuclease G [Candidatus Aerophobetes bacterium]
MKKILLNVTDKEKRVAFLTMDKLSDLIVERTTVLPATGNIYRGNVINILHNIQSAFINLYDAENGFIHINDIIENTKKFQDMYDMEFDWDSKNGSGANKTETDIAKLMKLGDPVLVQVVKEPMGSKGARLTSNISIPGRYLVLLPNAKHRGVSKKIQNRGERDRLKKIIGAFDMPKNMGLICRTASTEASIETLVDEAKELLTIWENITEKFGETTKTALLYAESNLIKKTVLRAVNKKYDTLVVDNQKAYKQCCEIYAKYEKEHPLVIEYYRKNLPMLDHFGIENEITKSLRRKIWLQKGGYLFFDRTEAMYTIDVNSGRSTPKKDVANVEESIVTINREAALEIARQLCIRNIGGLIIIDFIDMRMKKNQRRVLNALKEAMNDDPAKCTILNMSDFGLVEMTRQRTRESLIQTMFTHCPYCSGKGMIKNNESALIELHRALKKVILTKKESQIKLTLHPELYTYLGLKERKSIETMTRKWRAKVDFNTNDELHLNAFTFHSITSGEEIEV